jgi:Asp-tRNA(Asn)/Glu-tRNA(Gln) amidotransferase A subunit family amidase
MLIGQNAAEIIRHIADGSVSAEDYANAALARAQERTSLNAFITIDEAQVLDAARAADQYRRSGATLGPLHGLPIVIKDNIYTRDLPTSAGTPAFAGFRPGRDASTVSALLDAGAIMLGKTNLHELAFGVTSKNGHFGAVGNPYDQTRVAGGSSGGTASAISAGMVSAGLGTDTGGSTRIPAGFCGIAGFRPTAGRYGGDGVFTMSRTRDTVGPMANDVAGLRLLDAAMAFGVAEADRVPALNGMRFGFPRRMIDALAAPEMAAAVEAVAAKLRDAGATVVEIDLSDVIPLNAAASIPMAVYEIRRDWIAFLAETLTIGMREFGETIASPDVRHLFAMVAGDALPDAVYADAVGAKRTAIRHIYGRRFAEHGLTAILRPTTAVTAPPIAHCDTVKIGDETVDIFHALSRFTDPSSVIGLPSVTVPAGLLGGLPFGIDLDGAYGTDHDLLATAAAVEAVLGRLPPPGMGA